MRLIRLDQWVILQRWARMPTWTQATLLSLVAFLIFLSTAQLHEPLNNDAGATSLAAWQLATHGNLDLSAFHQHFGWIFESNGRWVTNRFPGTVFWATPFYLVFGHDSPNIYPEALAAASASAIAVGLMYLLLRKLVSAPTAAIGAAIFAFGTPTWTVSANQLWTHGPGQMVVLATVLLAANRNWMFAAVPAAFSVLVRPHLAVIPIILSIFFIYRDRSPRPAFLIGGVGLGTLGLLMYNNALWGHPSIQGGYTGISVGGVGAAHFVTNIAGALVSPERGILVMSPLIIPLVLGLRRGIAAQHDWVICAAVAGIAYIGVQLWLIRFSGGNGFYSYRTTLEGVTLCVPLLTLVWRDYVSIKRPARVFFAITASYSVAVHAFGAVVNWNPGGDLDPWTTFMPLDLMHHIGATETATWITVAALSCAVFTLIASRRLHVGENTVSRASPQLENRTA